ncbi:E3 ubiquitin-protein ligase RSL1 isoform X2 [Populus trichocarpa]|uniref:E3 ubiquitin-protein ligase RSL1 isoform X2 n=1 Tax=Populus trichocarpa TaxID=3694 RepID=UPI002278064D|nr:E3 ubiquitin-protein ligase RSL1 isoform X2 [Populus trichocarpa]XP_052309757.1 E3 ubiquitin-protein ligase RSL1 isoform X2 [Populus trichocarpa]
MGNTTQKSQETEVEEPGQLQQEEDSNFTCEICIEPMLAIRKFKNGSLCKHPFCLDCIAKYIEVKVEETTGCIECPGLNCKQLLDPLSCNCIISKPIFEKWCDHLCDSTVLGSESCYCPYQDCSVLVLNECRDKLTKIKCPNCKKSFCFLCKIPWHAGYQCNESRHLRDRNDILVGELIEEKKWTRCYNCGHSVERVSGCRDMKYAGLGFAINVEDHSISALVATGAVELFFVIYSFLWCYQLYATSYILKYIHAPEGRLLHAQTEPRRGGGFELL